MIDARSQNGIITLPLTTDIPYRILTLKDIYGASVASSITLTTQGADVFEDGTTSRLLNGAFETTTLYAGQAGYWYTTGGSRLASAAIGSLSTGLIANPLRLGTLSTQTSIQFPGLRANYTGTVIAGQTTGVGTQELLLYQASTVSDQIRLQTTGNIVFEAGASARSFPSTQTLATPTLYIAGTTSNVGIGTATPAATLDVAGQGRFQTVSTLALNVSTINGATPWQQSFLTSSVQGLGSAGYISSTQLYSTVSGLVVVAASAFTGSTTSLSSGSITTNALQAYSHINMTGGVFSNVATSFFTTPKFTTTFTPASISGLKVWLDASVTTSITSNGSGQVLSLSNLTGLGNATQGTPSSAPLTGQYTFNNLNVLSNSFNTQLVLPSLTYTSQYRTAFLVLQAPYYSAWIGANRSTDSIGMWSYGDLEIETAASWIALTSFPSNAQNIPIIIDIHSSAASNGVYMNGSNLGSLLRTFATGSFTDTIGLGGTATPLGGYYGGSWYFGEFIYYDAELTVSQRQTVEGYLAWKWGIQGLLAPTHPSYSAPPPPLGSVYLPAGSVGTDTGSNLTIQATTTTKISLAGNTQITGILTTSSIGVSSITGRFATLSSLQVSSINGLAVPVAFTGSTNFISASIVQATTLSTQLINTSTLNSVYFSSVQGYVSSLRTDNLIVGGPEGYVTVQDLTTGTVSTGQLVAGAGFISSLQINSLSFGPTGYVIVGNFIASSLSTMILNTQNMYTNNAFIGNVSSQSAILFPGVDGNFRGTAVAEQTTGAGTGELLLYKVSTTTDRIRLQTTGNIVFEAGAPARSWPSTQTLATPTLYIQGTTSNIGVGTATPGATLDVVGTVRGQILSTLTLNTSTINGIVPGAAFNGSTTSLSTGSITTTSLQAYSHINMTGGVFSNVATSFFTTPKYTTTFTPTSITGLKIWFDASVTTSILSNASGQVYQWNNLATGFANATQTTLANQPYTGLSNYNGLNAVSFTANNSLLNIGSISYTSSYRSFFIVYQFPATYTGGSPNITDALYIGNMSYPSFFFGQAVNSTGYNGYPIPSSAYSGGFGVVVGSVTTALGSPFYYNGSNNAIVSGSGSIFTSASYSGTMGGGLPMNISEYIVYDANLTSTQRQIVEGYLAWKWGFQSSLISTHPYFTVAPPPLGTLYMAAGSIGTDATSNLSIQATANTKIILAANTQITGILTTSSIGISSITGRVATLSSLQVSSINGLAVPTQFTGSTNFISASLVQAPILSTFNINLSTINGQTVVAPINSTMIGLGTLGYISSLSLQSTFRGLGTAGYISSSQLTSTLAGLGTFGYISTQSLQSTVAGLNIVATNAFTGSTTSLSAGTIFVSSLNVNTIKVSTIYITDTSLISTTGSVTQQDQLLYYNGMVFAGTLSWFGQMIIPPGPPLISVFSYTGASQTFVVPTSVNSVNAYMWAAGGGGGGTIVGGAGAFVQAAIPVTPGETLTLIVGGGGARNSSSAFGGGGVGGGGGFGTGGGGRTAIQRASTDYIVVGAGGGSTSYTGAAGIGGAGGILTGSPAVGTTGLEGQGGTQSAGGAGTSGVLSAGASGTAGAGGNAGGYGGGGGAGYYGGGGSGATTGVGASGGGGSSLVNNSVPILLAVSSDGTSAPNTGSQYYVSPVAVGGTNAASGNGGNGLIVLSYTAAPPATPSGLTLTLNGSTATLSWTSAGASLYYWAFYGNSVSAYTGTYLMSGSTAGTSVSYSISATFFDYFRLVGLSPLGCISAIASSPIVQVPAPSGLSLTSVGTAVTMSWSAVANATSYTYTLFSNSIFAYSGSSVATGSVSGTTATYSSGVAGTYYYFSVNATTSYGTSLSTTSGIVQGVPSFTATTFTYTGANQSYTVPSNAGIVNVYMWGAGGYGTGGNGNYNGGYGGAGAYLQGAIIVTASETLTIIVGGGGGATGTLSAYGGGGAPTNTGSSGGGGRSAIQRSNTDIVTVGAGGGAGRSNPTAPYYLSGGAGSWNGTGTAGDLTAHAGQGGTTSAGGAVGSKVQDPAAPATSGSLNTGGRSGNWGGGGGSGHYGGGGGTDDGSYGHGGGGGSSLITNLISPTGSNSSNGYSAPGTDVSYYVSPVAVGGTGGTVGGNGLVVVLPVSLASPTGLSLTPAAGNTATLSWTASTGATGYSWIVYQSATNGYFGSSFATGTTNSTTYTATVTGLNFNYYYYFTVIATGTTNSAAAVSAIMYELPDEPGAPTCTTSGTTVNMSWNAIAGALYYTYTVYQASGYAYTGIQVATANNGNSLTATYTGIATNYYYFTVSVTTSAGTSALATSGIAQAVTLLAPTVTTFSATGADQLYTFPTNAVLTLYMWGAAGGGTNSINGNFAGGAGAYVQGTLVATGAQYTIIVGKGGVVDGAAITTRAYKNGGAALNNDKAYIEGGGGGRSGLQLGGVNLIAVGAGGGAGGSGNGGAGGITSGANGSGPSTNYGLGGTQSAGGAAGTGTYNTASPGTQFGGGNAPTNGVGGGGGDGYYGGGGGVALGADQKGGGGGGGSSLTSNLSSLVTFVSSNGYSAPNTSSPYYQAGIAAGSPYATGGDGLVVVSASTNIASPANPTLVSSGSSATMSWTASTSATSYSWILYQSATNAYAGSSFATGTTTSATTATATGLTLNSYYYFTVSATGAAGTSSAVASAIVLQLITGPSSATLTASGTTLSLSWSSVAGVTSYTYTIYSNTAYSYTGITLVTSVSTASTSATYTGVSGTYYYFTVTATSASGTSAPTTSALVQVVLFSISATGGAQTTVNGYQLFRFLNTGTTTFTLSSPSSATAQVLVVGGGGAGGVGSGSSGGGGGAGGALFNTVSLTSGTYSVVVGAGGVGSTSGSIAVNGSNSVLSNTTTSTTLYTATGGGGGGSGTTTAGANGGCGGGAGSGNTPGTGSIGYNGGTIASGWVIGSGGGGMGSAGLTGTNNANGGNGGSGFTYSVAGSNYTLAGGGGGAGVNGNPGNGQAGGGNGGTNYNAIAPTSATSNTGSGGGGLSVNAGGQAGGSGGSGIVMIAFLPAPPTPTSPTLSITSGTATLGWTAAAAATGYSWILYRSSTNAYNGSSNASGTTTSTVTATVSSLSSSFFWYFTVSTTSGSASSAVIASSIVAY